MKNIGIIGGGPSGLMAAEVLSGAGHKVLVFEAMPTVGRKFLMAGKSGLNLTHAEPHEAFVARFGNAQHRLKGALDAFTGEDVRDWAAGLGQETFVGSSGRVFPTSMKGSPLLRAWLARLEEQGVEIRTRYRWVGFGPEAPLTPDPSPSRGEGGSYADTPTGSPSPLEGEGGPAQPERMRGDEAETRGALHVQFDTPGGRQTYTFDAVILALGGASWPRLGSDAVWVPLLESRGITVKSFRPANCGFNVAWSETFAERFAGQPVKSVVATSASGSSQGEFVITRSGIEGSLVYTHSAALRDALEQQDKAALILDLLPGRDVARIAKDIAKQGTKASFSNRMRKVGLDAVKTGLLREFSSVADRADPAALARRIKSLPLAVTCTRPIAEAISVAGGVAWDDVAPNFMLKALPGIFVAGEMLDWEAPTGGYLLTACMATGRAAARGVLEYLV